MIRCSYPLRALAGAVLFAWGGLAAAQTQNTTYQYQYDANGNLTQVTDPLGHVTKYGYDALNRRISLTDAGNGVTQYGYDGLGQLVSVTDPRNLTTRYTIDGLGNQSTLASPDTGTSVTTHDEAGNVQTSTDAKGQTTGYQYDLLHRVTQITYADGNVTRYEYDQGPNGIGRLTRIVDGSGSIDYGYDLHGRVVRDTRSFDGQSHTTLYRYDDAGRLAGITYPSGRSIDYARDGAGRISQIATTQGNATQVLVSNISYRPFGPAQSLTFGNNQTHTRSFDLDGRIASYTLNDQLLAISYDAASRITEINNAANAANNASYGYDVLDRLTSYLNPMRSLGYAYDAVGNRTTQVNGAATTNYSYGTSSNRLTQVAGSQTNTIATDANGSITNNGRNQFQFDARGRMVAAVTAQGSVQYRINALGQRVQKVTPSGATVFHYDRSGKLIGESSGALHTDYVYLDDMPVAVLK